MKGHDQMYFNRAISGAVLGTAASALVLGITIGASTSAPPAQASYRAPASHSTHLVRVPRWLDVTPRNVPRGCMLVIAPGQSAVICRTGGFETS